MDLSSLDLSPKWTGRKTVSMNPANTIELRAKNRVILHQVIQRLRTETCLLTPFGLRESSRMNIYTLKEVFGELGRDFVVACRNGEIMFKGIHKAE